jgi:hypothetical protein
MSLTVIAPPIVAKLGLILVDQSADLKKLIQRCRLDFVHPDIFAHLKQFETGKEGIERVDISIVHFNRPIGLLAVVRELNHLGFRGADFREFLEVGFRYPCLQCQFPLVAVGAGCKNNSGDCGVPYLWYNRQLGDRLLLLNQAAGFQNRIAREFQPFCRFVVVSKNSAGKSAN